MVITFSDKMYAQEIHVYLSSHNQAPYLQEYPLPMNKNILLSWPRPFDESPLQETFPNARFTKCALLDPGIEAAAAEAEIWVAGGPAILPNELAAASKLEWIQFFGSGLSPALFEPEFRDRNVLVTNAKGINLANMAEHAFAMMLAFARAIPQFSAAQAKSHWVDYNQFPPLFELEGQTIGIVGYGAIGEAVAKRARAMDMTVWAMRRTPTEADLQAVDQMFSPEELNAMLAGCDHVVLCAPLTDYTRGMIGEEQLAAMKPSARIYNIGRGPLINNDALVNALEKNLIAGAGLDVTDPEPLTADSPLWANPNVLITPHAAGITPKFFERTLAFVADQICRYEAGDMLKNIIDLQGGN